jgi:hypothetical protein
VTLAKVSRSSRRKKAAEKRTYTAVGHSGQPLPATHVVMTHVVDVADKDGSTEKAKAGQVWTFFTSREKAEAWAAKMNGSGYDCVITEAKAVTARSPCAAYPGRSFALISSIGASREIGSPQCRQHSSTFTISSSG